MRRAAGLAAWRLALRAGPLLTPCRDNPLSFRHVSLATSVGEALGEGGGQRWRQGVSRVVVATQEDLEGGMAQEVLERCEADCVSAVAQGPGASCRAEMRRE